MRLFTPRRLILTSLLACIIPLAVSVEADARWADARDLAGGLESVAKAVDHHRPVLVGESVEGSAHAAYEQALAVLGETPDADFDLFRKVRDGNAPELPAVRVALMETYGSALEHLAEGARRTDGGQQVDWSEGLSVSVPSLRKSRHLVDLAIADAELLLAGGDPEAATDRVLQALQFAGDMMRAPTYISHAVGQALLTTAGKAPMIDRGMLDRLPPACLARLDEGLARLDASLPDFEVISAAEIALTVRTVAKALENDGMILPGFDSLAETWRHGFSQRLRCSSLVHMGVAAREVQVAVTDLDWPQAEAHYEDHASLEGEGRLFLDLSKARSLELGRRSALAYLRITRAAIGQRLEGQVPTIPNPFGGDLVATGSGGVLRIEAPCAADPSGKGWPAVDLPLATD